MTARLDLARLRRRAEGFFRRHRNARSAAIGAGAFLAATFVLDAAVDAAAFELRKSSAERIAFSEARERLTSGEALARAEIDNGWLFLAGQDGGREQAARLPTGAPETVARLFEETAAPLDDRGPRSSPVAVLSALLMLGFLAFIARYMMQMTGLGRSVGTVLEVEEIATRFGDVAGADEPKRDLMEFVRLIRGDLTYGEVGARTPRGVMLHGPPGTGKTLLARATAGEADVNFIAATGSDFGGMLIGQGARDVAGVFAKARRMAPSILFLDEIDAVGKKRGQRSHDDYETTLNKLLSELDGMQDRAGVWVIAATNHPDALDEALIRPGRFDRVIRVPLPDLAARRTLLEVHTRALVLAPEVALDAVARQTAGLSGAQLENLANEAAIQAGRRGAGGVEPRDFEAALMKVSLGEAVAGTPLTEAERRRLAWHEAGHAVLTLAEPLADPVHRVTIEPRGDRLGHVMTVPEGERRVMTREALKARMRVVAGGRAGELVGLGEGEASSLAADDVAQVSRMAVEMAGRFAMSERLGFFAAPQEGPFAQVPPEVLAEARTLAAEALAQARTALEGRRAALAALAEALVERETLTGEAAAAVVAAAGGPGTVPAAAE